MGWLRWLPKLRLAVCRGVMFSPLKKVVRTILLCTIVMQLVHKHKAGRLGAEPCSLGDNLCRLGARFLKVLGIFGQQRGLLDRCTNSNSKMIL